MDMATIDGLEARVRFLADEVEGEKAVTRHVLEQAIRNGDVLLALRSEVASSRLDLNALTSRLDHVAGDVVVANAALRSHGSLLNVLRQDVASLRQEVDHIRTDTSEIRAEMDRRFGAMDHRFGAMEHRFGAMEHRFGAMEHNIAAMEHNIAAILAVVAPPNPPT
jgi:chromosome segregation ATPase